MVMQRFIQQWIKISLASLAVVALLGCVLRYKIAFSLPFIDQKYLLHAHSHFAFSGWITQALMACLVGYLFNQGLNNLLKKYRILLTANLLTACGMLFTFPWEGYGLYSIVFSTLSIFVSYFFAVIYWRDLNRLTQKNIAHSWFKLAVLFNAVSSIGAFSLAFMMATKNMHQEWYMAAIYFFLHFQYNGWFFFGCMGLFTVFLLHRDIDKKYLGIVFQSFAYSVVPIYFLSILWAKLPAWLYVIIVLSALSQTAGFVLLVIVVKRQIKNMLLYVPRTAVWLAGFAAFALLIKLSLQLFSVIPSLNQLVFGFRPIVIGYLHLVFLGITTFFILSYSILQSYIVVYRLTWRGICVFSIGVIVNEGLLMVQGITALAYTSLPYINELLLAAAIIMFTGITLTVVSQCRPLKIFNHLKNIVHYN
jgi:hypothetical protein